MFKEISRSPRYCWVVLGIAWLTLVTINWAWYLIPSLAYQIMPDLALSQSQYTLILTSPITVAIFTSLPGGALGDRYGIRRIVAIGAFIIAISGLLRAFLPSFSGMLLMMCLRGVAWGMVVPNLPKLVGVWFPPNRIGIASGIYQSGLGIGLTLGLLTGPMFGDWRTAFIVVGILSLIISTLWVLLARDCPAGMILERPNLLGGLKKGLASRNIWLVAISAFLLQAGLLAFLGNFPRAMQEIHAFNPKTAGALSSMLTLGLVIGNFTLPALSDKIGLRKPFMIIGPLVGAVAFYLTWLLAPGSEIWVLAVMGGIIMGGAPPLILAIPAELPEIDKAYVGGASGLVNSLMNFGGFLMPLLVTDPIMAAGTAAAFNNGFMVAGLFFAGMMVPMIIVRETGPKGRK